jgi:hypothetical protein
MNARTLAIGDKWGVLDRILQSRSFHLADGSLKWAAVRAATASEADDCAADRFFLVGKGEADKDGGVEI